MAKKFVLASDGSRLVDQSSHNPKSEGSNPAPLAQGERKQQEKNQKKQNICFGLPAEAALR
jgi:hypothetical protein